MFYILFEKLFLLNTHGGVLNRCLWYIFCLLICWIMHFLTSTNEVNSQ